MSTLVSNLYDSMNLFEANKLSEHFEDREAFYYNLMLEHHILDVLSWYPASDGTFHKWGMAKSYGKGAWKDLNEGYTASHGSIETMTSAIKVYGAVSNVNDDTLRAVAAGGGDASRARQAQDTLVARGIVEDFLSGIITADGSDEKAPKGFEYYRSSLGDYCLDAGGTTSGSMTSIWLIEPGEERLNLRYSPGLSGSEYGVGLSIQDMGKSMIADSGKQTWMWTTKFDMSAALELKTEKALVRICNIDLSNDFPASLFIDALHQMDSQGRNAVAICAPAVHAQLMKYCLDKSNVNFTVESIGGFGNIAKVFGVPVLIEEAVPTTEAVYA